MKDRIYKTTAALALGSIILLGFLLRAQNLEFPSIGYHNLSENEYLLTARQMKTTGDYLLNKVSCYNVFSPPARICRPQPSLVSYQILLAWRLFDENLWSPRLLNVIFGVLSILAIYLIASILFKNPFMSLASSLVLAIVPLAVFFSRNLQPESPAFFFMALANLFYLRFASSRRAYNLIISGLTLSIACIYRFNFFITIVPFIFCFPFRACFGDRKALLRVSLISLLWFAITLSAMIWMSRLGLWDFSQMIGPKPPVAFSLPYYVQLADVIGRHIRYENFTIIYALLALAGAAAAILKRRGLANRYLLGWAAAAVLYVVLYPGYLMENNFSQMPFLLFVPLAAIYGIRSISAAMKRYVKADLFVLLMIIAVTASLPFVYASILRLYGTIFFGADIAGESLREFTRPREYIFLSSHVQGYAIIRYSERRGGWTDDPEKFRRLDKRYGIRYACFYPMDNLYRMKVTNPPLYEYLRKNYHVKEIGLTEEPTRLYYIILEKGKGLDHDALMQSISGPKRLRTIYRMFDSYVFFYVLSPSLPEKPQTPPAKPPEP